MSNYKVEVIDPGARASKLAHRVNIGSFNNSPAVEIIPHKLDDFRGAVGYVYLPHIYRKLAKKKMCEEAANDGAGGKPQFHTLVGLPQTFGQLGWEIIVMTADDFARSGRFPAVMINQTDIKAITKENFHLVRAAFLGYGRALAEAELVSLTGETAVMKNSITAFCDTGEPDQLVMTWSGTCLGFAHRDLLLDGSTIRPGMVIVCFRTKRGYRCNGGGFYTKVIQARWGRDPKELLNNADAVRFATMLTAPSRLYARTLNRLLGWKLDGTIGKPLAKIHGIAHITGGGIWDKFGGILPKGVGADLHNMPKPNDTLIFGQLLSLPTEHYLSDWEAHGTLNGGCDMLLVCEDERNANKLIAEAKKDRIEAQIIGKTTESPESIIRINSRFKEGGELRSDQPPEK